jgi:hypothetical protein
MRDGTAQAYPRAARLPDDEERSSMAVDAEQHLRRLLGETPKRHEDADFGHDAEELVEEAYVVLRSLPGPTGPPLPRH